MFGSQDVFKFYVREYDVFTLEKILVDNNIEFHNELIHGTNANSNKYYIKNSDRPLLDKYIKINKLEIFIDSIPNIEVGAQDLKITTNQLLVIFAIVLIGIILFSL